MIIKVFTAFSGYDSQCMALEKLKENFPGFDFELVGWSDIDKPAIASHNAVFPQWADRNYGDISKINWKEVDDIDLFTYSSPCTNYSICGKMQGGEEGSGTPSSLLWECKKAIEIKRPKFCILENVKNMTSKKFISQFVKWERTLKELGYRNTWTVLNSGNYNNCQNRERVFMVSIREDNHDISLYYFPKRVESTKNAIDYLEDRVDDKYYLSKEQTQLYLNKVKASGLRTANIIGKPVAKLITPTTAYGLLPTLMATGNQYANYKNMISEKYYPKLGVLEVFDSA